MFFIFRLGTNYKLTARGHVIIVFGMSWEALLSDPTQSSVPLMCLWLLLSQFSSWDPQISHECVCWGGGGEGVISLHTYQDVSTCC